MATKVAWNDNFYLFLDGGKKANSRSTLTVMSHGGFSPGTPKTKMQIDGTISFFCPHGTKLLTSGDKQLESAMLGSMKPLDVYHKGFEFTDYRLSKFAGKSHNSSGITYKTMAKSMDVANSQIEQQEQIMAQKIHKSGSDVLTLRNRTGKSKRPTPVSLMLELLRKDPDLNYTEIRMVCCRSSMPDAEEHWPEFNKPMHHVI